MVAYVREIGQGVPQRDHAVVAVLVIARRPLWSSNQNVVGSSITTVAA